MKKNLLILLMVLVAPFLMKAQDSSEVTIGTGTSTSYTPGFYPYYKNTWFEAIYSADEIGQPGLITSLSLNYSTSYAYTCSDIRIYMGHRSTSTHANNTDWTPLADLTLVYEGANMTIGAQSGWNQYELTNPFLYDGTDNLVVVFAKKAPNWSSSLTVYYTSMANTCLYRYSDSDEGYAEYPTASGTLSGMRPNVKLLIGNPDCMPPAGVQIANIGTYDCTITWNNEEGDNFIYQYKTPDQDWEDAAEYTTFDSEVELTSLSANSTYNFRIKRDCSDESSIWVTKIFKTYTVLATIPYSNDFSDDEENAQWQLSSTASNHWFIGTATSYENDGVDKSLYISNDAIGTYLADTITGFYYAERFIDFGETPSSYTFTVDWKASGNQNGNSVTSGIIAYLRPGDEPTPSGWPSYVNEYSLFDAQMLDWEHAEFQTDNLSGVMKLQFLVWGLQAESAHEVLPAIDNITITETECITPAVDSIVTTANTATIYHNGPADADYYVLYRKASDGAAGNQSTMVSGNIFTLEDLQPATDYYVWIAQLCGSDTSIFHYGVPFTTKCGIIVVTDENAWLESFESQPNCWDFESGEEVVSFYADGYIGHGYGNYTAEAITPPIDVTAVTTPYVSFDEQASDYDDSGVSDHMYIYYRTVDGDETGEWVKLYGVSDVNVEFTNYKIPLPEGLATIQLKLELLGNGDDADGCFIDNLSVYNEENPISCLLPFDLAVAAVTSSSVDLTWVNATETPMTLSYKKISETEYTVLENVELTDGVYHIDGLEASTEYQWRLSMQCGEELLQTQVKTFATTCAPITEVPVYWDFESGNTAGTYDNPLPECWLRTGVSYYYPYAVSSTNSYEGSYSLYNYANNDNIVVMRGVDPDALNIAELQLSFWSRTTFANGDSIIIGVMSSPDNIETFKTLATVHISNVYDFYEVPLSLYEEGDGMYLAFRYKSTNSSGSYIDNLTLENIPECPKPFNLTASNVTNTTATLSWESVSDEVNVYYKSEDAEEYTVIENVSLDEEGFLLEELSPATWYQWYVGAICEDTVVTSQVKTFLTLCEVITEMPYFNNFDNSVTNDPPLCWSQINPYNGFPKVTTGNTYNGSAKKLEIRNAYSGGGTPSYAVFPQFAQDLSELQVTFWHRKEGSSSGTFSVGYMTDPSNANTFVELWSTNGSAATTTYTYQVVEFSSLAEDEDYDPEAPRFIAFKYNCTTNWYWFVDDVTVEPIPACDAASDLEKLSTTATTATLTWNNASENTNISYKKSTETAWTTIEGITIDEDGNYTIENLEPITTYNWRVENVCEDGSVVYSLVAVFTTECADFEAPFLEEFSSSSLPQCWKMYKGLASDIFNGQGFTSTSAGWYSSSSYIFTDGHYYLNIYGTSKYDWLVTPNIDLSNLANPALSFDLALTEYASTNPITPGDQADDKFIVAVSTDGGLTWNAANAIVWDNTGNGDYSYDNISSTGQTIYIPLTQYANQTIKIAFYGESTIDGGDNNLHIDNVSVDEMPTCMPPANLSISEITDNSATVTWVSQGEETSWIFEYKEAGETDWEEMTVTTPEVQLTGLTTLTYYDVRVKADCGDETSTYTSGSFVTICGAENQCTYSIEMTDEYGDGWNGCEVIVIQNGIELAVLTIDYGGAGTPITETFNLCDGIETEFVWSEGSWASEVGFTIYDPNGTVIVEQPQGSMANFASGTAIHTFTTDCQGSGPAECVVPTALAVNGITETAATATWTAGGNETAWKLQYKTAAATSWGSEIDVNTTPSYQMTGLTAGTEYQVRVKAVCGDGNESQWTEAIAFTTNSSSVEPCNTPTNVAASNITKESMTITWNANGASKWNLQYRVVNGAWSTVTVEGNPTYTITDLTEATEYQIQVQAVCDGATSPWSTMISQSTGINARLMGSISLYPNPASNYVDVRVSDNDIAVSRLEVYDVYGKLINEVEVIENPTRINVENLASGMYFVKVITNDGVATKNFIKK